MPLNEFSLIKNYFTRQAQHSSVIQSIGDDCAILDLPAHKQLVISMDTLVAGRHFPDSATPYQIGSRALCTSASDLAAMGAVPLWFTLGLTLPSINEQWLTQFSEGLFAAAAPFAMDLIGGDTTQGPLTITVQVHGVVDKNGEKNGEKSGEKGQALRRDSAQVGDHIFVSNYLGDGAAALALIQQRISASLDEQDYLLSRFYSPTPQIALGQLIAPFTHAAIDISDGLLADAQHIADASQVGLQIDVDFLPIHPCLQQYGRDQYLEWALTGGDDYQLLFTVSEKHISSIKALMKKQMINVTKIGRVVEKKAGVQCHSGGVPFRLASPQRGYQHFTA